MPNGGSDCCGTCWFNRANGGRRGSRFHDRTIPSYCEIRGLEIENPFYTYCANHPYRRPEPDPIPVGPVVTGYPERKLLHPAPDTPEIRQHLLDLLIGMPRTTARDFYPIGSHLAPTVIRQLGELREERAIPFIELIIEKGRGHLADVAREALARIKADR